MEVNIDLINMKSKAINELWDIKKQKMLIKYTFTLNIYSYMDIINMCKKYNLQLIKIRGRFSENNVFPYESQAIFIFKKI